MKTEDIQNKIYNILLDKFSRIYNKKYEEKLTPETQLQADMGFDSLDICEIGLEVEKEFNITIPDTDNEQVIMRDVKSMIAYINQKIGLKTPDTTKPKTMPVQPAPTLQTPQSYEYYYNGVRQILEKTFNMQIRDAFRPAAVHDFIDYMAKNHESLNLAETIAKFNKTNQK